MGAPVVIFAVMGINDGQKLSLCVTSYQYIVLFVVHQTILPKLIVTSQCQILGTVVLHNEAAYTKQKNEMITYIILYLIDWYLTNRFNILPVFEG